MTYTTEQLSDQQEIRELTFDYSHAIDQQQFDMLDNIFTPDAFIDYTAMGGPEGNYPDIKKFLQDTLPAFSGYYHLVANHRIYLDGDKASGRLMCFNPMGIPQAKGEPHTMLLGLYYLDEYVRTEQGWRICRREEERSWSYNVPDGVNAG